MFTYKNLLARKYRDEAGDDGDAGGGSTTGVETDTGDKSTVLTGDAAADESGKDSDAGADAAAEGDAKLDADGNPIADGDADAGKESSDEHPDTYADFAMPEGMQLDETALAEATPLFKELGLTQEQGQKVIDLYAKQVQAGSQLQTDNFNQLMNDWRTDAKNDGDIGGDKFDENVKIAQSAVAKYGTPELKQLLEDHGVGNHVEVIRFMVRVGRTLNEDVPGSTGSAQSKAEDAVSILYPNDS